jgi:hypothetical protein
VTFSRAFLRFAAACAVLSALTTFGVHLFPNLYPAPATFEAQVALHANPIWVFRLWWVLVHILLVLISMWGFAGVKLRTAAGPVGIGLMGFLLFGFAEFVRVSFSLFALRAWRAQYAAAGEEAAREALRTLLEAWPGINRSLFFLLAFGFLLGNLFYGIATRSGEGLEKGVGAVLLLWSAISLAGILNDYGGVSFLALPEWLSVTFQPAARVLVGIWLWKSAGEAARRQTYA